MLIPTFYTWWYLLGKLGGPVNIWVHSKAVRVISPVLQVLEQKPDGIWKGYVVQSGRMAKTGFFPANHVVLVDSQGEKIKNLFQILNYCI